MLKLEVAEHAFQATRNRVWKCGTTPAPRSTAWIKMRLQDSFDLWLVTPLWSLPVTILEMAFTMMMFSSRTCTTTSLVWIESPGSNGQEKSTSTILMTSWLSSKSGNQSHASNLSLSGRRKNVALIFPRSAAMSSLSKRWAQTTSKFIMAWTCNQTTYQKVTAGQKPVIDLRWHQQSPPWCRRFIDIRRITLITDWFN